MKLFILSIMIALNLCPAPIPPSVNMEGLCEVEIVYYEPRYTEDDVYIMAQMLQGECYEWDEQDQRNAAITVCNRVDSTQWAQNSVQAVIKQTGYYGYRASNTPSETNLRVAKETLDDWSAMSAGYERPWADWLFFSSINGVNVYRVRY